jgi:hypothetical protein
MPVAGFGDAYNESKESKGFAVEIADGGAYTLSLAEFMKGNGCVIVTDTANSTLDLPSATQIVTAAGGVVGTTADTAFDNVSTKPLMLEGRFLVCCATTAGTLTLTIGGVAIAAVLGNTDKYGVVDATGILQTGGSFTTKNQPRVVNWKIVSPSANNTVRVVFY